MEQFVTILGRQPALGIAELESICGAPAVQPYGSQACLLNQSVNFQRLGGSVKLAKVLKTVETTDWRKLELQLTKLVTDILPTLGDGKIQLGISVYDIPVHSPQLLATGLTLKKAFRKHDRSVRLVPNQEPALNSASVLHNKLTGPQGCEFLLISDGTSTVIARTTDVQDIDSYTLRDRGRPKRDARVGMLPPKLAQIIINLAVSTVSPAKEFRILDPFCGTGVVLQEAMLMGYSADGSDIEPRMGEYTIANLDWLWRTYPVTQSVLRGWQLGDATMHSWASSKTTLEGDEVVDAELVPMAIQAVASETYLGKPFTSLPPPEILAQTINDCNTIIRKFLVNIRDQMAAGTRLCLAVPAWQVHDGHFRHLPLLDSLPELGYNRVSFEHVRPEELIYYRSEQTVARELLVITKQ